MLSPRKLSFYAKKNEAQNYRFRSWLKFHADPEELDQHFLHLHKELFEDYDCSRCRNCCKQYYGSVPKRDIERDASALGMSVSDFVAEYFKDQIDEGEQAYSTKNKPCDFLQEDGSCLLGDHKPENCKKYPFTDQPDRMGSLLSFLDTISICPVAYEIWERLKEEYSFRG